MQCSLIWAMLACCERSSVLLLTLGFASGADPVDRSLVYDVVDTGRAGEKLYCAIAKANTLAGCCWHAASAHMCRDHTGQGEMDVRGHMRLEQRRRQEALDRR